MEQIYYEDNPQLALSKCTACLEAGGTAVIPAGTVYGIVALSESAAAYQQIYKMKRRVSIKPIALLVSETCELFHSLQALLSSNSELNAKFLAGQLTVVVEADRVKGVSKQVQQIQPGTVGIRHPANSPACSLIQAVGGLVWATSANLSEQPACSTVEEIVWWLQEVNPAPDLVVFSRQPQQGQPSRVVKITE